MYCPACGSALLTLEYNQIEIDYCDDCKGIWLDYGELALLVSNSDSMNNFHLQITELHNSDEAIRNCPICYAPMKKVKYKSILLDKCPNKHGIWFDHKELSDLLAIIDDSSEVLSFFHTFFTTNDK